MVVSVFADARCSPEHLLVTVPIEAATLLSGIESPSMRLQESCSKQPRIENKSAPKSKDIPEAANRPAAVANTSAFLSRFQSNLSPLTMRTRRGTPAQTDPCPFGSDMEQWTTDDDMSLEPDINVQDTLQCSGSNLTSLLPGQLASIGNFVTIRLGHNSLFSIVPGTFGSLPSVTGLFLSYNSLTSLGSGALGGMPALQTLELAHNLLCTLAADLLSGLSTLQILDLSYNNLVTLDPTFFQSTPNLRDLDLSYNLFTTISETLFFHLTNLRSLSLGQNNQLSFLPSSVFQTQARLLTLNLGGTSMESVTLDLFQNLTSLWTLSLSGGSLSFLDSNVFSPLASLQYLFLGSSLLPALPSSLFSSSLPIKYLYINNCGLLSLPGFTFASLTGLEQLFLNHNQISLIDESILSGLLSLRTLSLANNKINTIAPFSFNQLSSLLSLDLSQNLLTQLSAQFQGLTLLQELNLKLNSLTSMPQNLLMSLTYLRRLWLNNNQLTSLPDPLFFNSISLSFIDLSNNLLTSLPMYVFTGCNSLTQLDISRNLLTTLPAGVFTALSFIVYLSLAFNMLSTLTPGIFDPLVSLVTLDLTGNGMPALPLGLFTLPSLSKLLLPQNNITTLPSGIFANLSSLTTLNLDQNRLTTLAFPGVFNILTALQILSVSRNHITRIGPRDLIYSYPLGAGFSSFVQGTCVGPSCPRYLPRSSGFQLFLMGNPIQYFSKTAFDILPAHVLVYIVSGQLQLSATVCCGLAWLTTTPNIVTNGAVLCNRQPLSQVVNSEICNCKQKAQVLYPLSCLSLANWTFVQSAPNSLIPNCAAGCLPGFRPFQAQSYAALNCTYEVAGASNSVFLYNTACQECFVANCSQCTSSLTGCDLCKAGLFVLTPGPGQPTQCVADCSAYGPFFNDRATSACADCPLNCAACFNNGTCTRCQLGYGVYQAQCLSCATAGLDLQDCPSRSIRITSPFPYEVVIAAILSPFVAAVLVYLGYRAWRSWRAMKVYSSGLEFQLLQAEQEFRKAWEIDWAEVDRGPCIGQGAMGQVWQGTWRGMAVAVKVLTGVYSTNEELREEMDREATMLRTVRHAHVVQFYGIGSTDEGTPFIVTELMELGSLTACLKDAATDLPWDVRQRFAVEIAQGMALVHSLGSMHRDLKSGNILVTSVEGVLHVKVADFGTASLHAASIAHAGSATTRPPTVTDRLQTTRDHTKGIGTPLWMAPEILGMQKYGLSADVYSYGILLWEIAARDEPWREITDTFLSDALLTAIRSGRRPAIEPTWPQSFVSIMTRCWATAPASRPTFARIVKEMTGTKAVVTHPGPATTTTAPTSRAGSIVSSL